LAHNLQINGKVTEIYLANAEIPNSKYLLFVYDNGSLKLEWCSGNDIVEIQENPTLSKIGKRMLLEYGEANLFNIRQKLPFQDEQGNLDEMWEKVM